MIEYNYEYDLINHPYLSEVLDSNDGWIVQSFTVPEEVEQIRGVRIKVSKYGSPGPIQYKLGSFRGGGDIAEGIIDPGDVLPVFETMIGDDFPAVGVEGGQKYYLALRVSEGEKPYDAYRFYGPNTREDTGDPGNTLLAYWWYEDYEIDDDMDIPIPRDYRGSNLPEYAGGSRYREDGTETWNLSFAILTDHDERYPQRGEQTFEFAHRLLADPFEEWQMIRDPGVQPKGNQLVIDETWGLVFTPGGGPILANTIAEIRAFFSQTMGVELKGTSGERNIRLILDQDAGVAEGDESFIIEVLDSGVRVIASHEKGLMRAIHWLEDRMLLLRAPMVELGTWRVQPKYRLRMVPGIYPAPSYFMMQEEQVWTPGYMWRLARAGYNAIYFQTNIEELVEESSIFPEMDNPQATVVIERLRRVVDLGVQFGVDVYFDLKTGYFKKFDESIYERVPEIRTFQKWGNYPCGGQQMVLDFYKETISNVFRKAEKLKGMVVIYDTEGFYSCFLHNKKDQCPYCKDYPIEELSNRLFNTLKEAIRGSNDDTELILWSYFCDKPWNYKVIEAMPSDITMMACFSQFRELDRCGVKIRTDDYSICSDQPSEYFLNIRALAKKKGMRFICKTEDTFGQEFVSTPYTPCLEQHQRRWDQVNQQGVEGYLSQYIHHGFTPGPCADLTRQNMYRVEKDGLDIKISPQQKLENVAGTRFGSEVVEDVILAWKAFSTAIRDHFPYTWGVCRYPGPIQSAPAQPFYIDPSRPMPRLRSRGYVNDLRWTHIDKRFLVDPDQVWNADIVSRCLQGFRHHYGKGIQSLQTALNKCAPEFRNPLISELNIAQTQYYQVRALLNYIQFLTLRDSYSRSGQLETLKALIHVCEEEWENAQAVYAIAVRDSRIGFSCEGAGSVRGGLFTPLAIQQKIDALRETLDELYIRLDRE